MELSQDERLMLVKKKEEILQPIAQVQKCWSCEEENAPVAVYCHSCGESLALTQMKDMDKFIAKFLEKQGWKPRKKKSIS